MLNPAHKKRGFSFLLSGLLLWLPTALPSGGLPLPGLSLILVFLTPSQQSLAGPTGDQTRTQHIESVLSQCQINSETAIMPNVPGYGNSQDPVHVMSDNELVQLINSRPDPKLEVGAANKPVLTGENSIFVDVVESTLDQTKQYNESYHKNAQYIHSDASKIPLPDGTVSTIVSKHFSWHMRDTEPLKIAIVVKYYSLLKPGGEVFIFARDLSTDLTSRPKREFEKCYSCGKSGWISCRIYCNSLVGWHSAQETSSGSACRTII